MILGGSGNADVARNDMGATGANSEAHDADVVVANNGDIVRLVGTTHSAAAGFLHYGYDTAAFESGGSERIVARAVKLLDYTPGGTDLNGGRLSPATSAPAQSTRTSRRAAPRCTAARATTP